MISVIIDEAYSEMIKEVSEWMVDEYAGYAGVKDNCIHSAEMLNHGKLIRDLLDKSKFKTISLFDDSLYFLNYAVNDLICNSDKREKLKNINPDDLKSLNLYLENLIQEVKE